MSIKLKILTILTTLSVALDQLSKFWIVRTLRYSGPPLPAKSPFSLQGPLEGMKTLGYSASNPDEIPIIPGFLSFIHAQNPGAALGMLNRFEWRLLVFYAFTGVAVFVLLGMYKALQPDDRFQSATIALILSGALGNFIDRLHKATVTDFVRVYTESPSVKPWLIEHFHTAEYPTWNVADAAIVVGVGMYLINYLFFERDKETGSDPGKNPLEEEGAGTPV